MSRIDRIACFTVGIPILRTFQFASGNAGAAGAKAPVAFVKITDTDGCVGWGEGRPLPAWSYETIESVGSAVTTYFGPALHGHDPQDRIGTQRKMHALVGRGPSTGMPIAKAAIDIALHDLAARQAGLPLRCLLGGPVEAKPIELSWTLTAHEIESVKDDIAEGRDAGMIHFNFKPGVHPENDEIIAETVRANTPDGAFVWADANQSLQQHYAPTLAAAFERIGIDLLEQPFPANQIGMMRRLRQTTRLPLAIDEACVDSADLLNYLCERLIDYYVIKVTRSGGLQPSGDQVALARAAGLPCVVSGLTDSMITKVAACQLAAANGIAGPAALNGSQFLDDRELFPAKGDLESGGVISLPDGPGLGIAPDEGGLKAMAL